MGDRTLPPEPACRHDFLGCDCYGTGYAAGKSKALFEVETYDVANLRHDNGDLGLAIKALLRSAALVDLARAWEDARMRQPLIQHAEYRA